MPFHIIRGDIACVACDAILVGADPSLLGGGGADGCLRAAAGAELEEECRRVGPCPVGEARATGGGRLACRTVIHLVPPRWQDGAQGEETLLRACLRAGFALAGERGCESLALPLIASGACGFPKETALRIVTEEVEALLLQQELQVTLVVFDREAFLAGSARFQEIRSCIDERTVERLQAADRRRFPMGRGVFRRKAALLAAPLSPQPEKRRKAAEQGESGCLPQAASLDQALRELDESFSQMLLRKITERGMTDAQCYRKANIDRKLFSKIRSDVHYQPSKPTAIAFALALELPPGEFRELLGKAGFALSRANAFDVIIEFFVERGNYNVFEINETLFAFDQSLIGA